MSVRLEQRLDTLIEVEREHLAEVRGGKPEDAPPA
jgi:hypothetical protein